MTKLFLYIVAASSNPDELECFVPYRIDADEIFFGPCKRRLRDKLYRKYLSTSDEAIPDEDIYLVGVNGSNPQQERKIVWAGRIMHLFTFAAAYQKLDGSKYQGMRAHPCSPLHVKPIYSPDHQFRGYEHRSDLHIEADRWITDILPERHCADIIAKGNQILLKRGAIQKQVFTRDCCLLLENIFFAQGKGISITDKMLDSLREIQPDKNNICPYSLFGRRSDGSVIGLAGQWLDITDHSAEQFIDLIKSEMH